MVLGELTEESTQYGKQAVTVKPIAGAELSEQLSDALANIHAEIAELEQMEEAEESVTESIPADPSVRNFSFTVVNGERSKSATVPEGSSSISWKAIPTI